MFYVMEYKDADRWVLISRWDGSQYRYARPDLAELMREANESYRRTKFHHRIFEYKRGDDGNYGSAVVYEVPAMVSANSSLLRTFLIIGGIVSVFAVMLSLFVALKIVSRMVL